METQNSFDLIEFLSKSFHCLCRNVNFADKINFLFLLKSTWEYHSNNAAWMIKEVFISFDQPYLFTSWSLSLWNKLCINCQVFRRKNFVHNASKGWLIWEYIVYCLIVILGGIGTCILLLYHSHVKWQKKWEQFPDKYFG